ncbi:tetratricopeptide repeat protein [Dictyobacter aurantiacus]|uniref:HTH cro/C1-type domain-containing protein n=1 Tax=Dictyobacter aurantiacus TaxID=1936993 RepID=A0A401ZML9_9CHLR|nr:tetratricopeptide repeat protein [Dictyobacter aurantiacus]GCE08109.1 hypothetical protein KDAU_54380 [Dictyobacter aurantiacus]
MKKPARNVPNQHLKQARVRQGWSQEYVAREVGTDAFTVSRWERGVTMPGPHFRLQLCTLFKMSVLELGLVPEELEERTEPDPSPPPSDLPQLVQTPIWDPAIPPAPAGGSGLIGRDGLLGQIKQQLMSERRVKLSALHGLPGVGKTALAIALAHDAEIQAHFSDGILWVGLGRQPDVLGLLSRWGAILGCAPADMAQRSKPEAWAASIHAAIGQRQILLVLDDAWKITDALALQVGGPHCAHLVTTRFPEIARRFAVDGTTIVRELEDTDGRLLLMRLAPDSVQAEPQEAQALVNMVGGLPLALTLLGNFLRAQSHSGQPRRIRAALERLRSADERLRLAEPQALIGAHPSLEIGAPLSLQTVIGISVQQISDDARTTLGALAVFPPKPNTFSEEAAVEISALPVETLDELSDAGLLESSGPERYTLHQTIADYASSHLSESTVYQRLVTYFVAYADQHARDYVKLDLESNNILLALELAHTHSMQSALIQGTHAFAPFLITRGLYTLAVTLLQRSLSAAQALEDYPAQVSALLSLGKIDDQRSNYSNARTMWQNALSLARQHADVRSSAQVLRELGNLAHRQGQPELARQFLSEALEAQIQLGDESGSAETQGTLADVIAAQGEPELARKLYTEALATLRRLGDQRGAALILGRLGVLAREQSQPEQARLFYDEALAIFRKVGDQHNISVVLINLGNLTRQQGQPEQARLFYEEALEITQRIENRRTFAFTILNLGSMASDQGHFEQARQLFNQAIPIFRELQDQRSLAITLQSLGSQEVAEGLLELARSHLDEARTLFSKIADKRQTALITRDLGALARCEGHLDEAHALLDEALPILEQLGDQREAAVVRQEMGTLALQKGQLEQARALFVQALDVMRQMEDRRNIAHTLLELGRLAWQEQRAEEALRYLLGAGVGMKLMHWFEISDVERLLALVRAQLGDPAFRLIARQVAHTEPEPAYGLKQAAWIDMIQQVLANSQEAHL